MVDIAAATGRDVTDTDDASEAVKLFDFVRFTFADFHGIARSKTITSRNFRDFFRDGTTIFSGLFVLSPKCDISFVPDEVTQLNLGNMTIKPIPGTLHSLPWATNGEHRIGEVFCETFWIPPFRDGAPQDACPRYVARRQLDRLAELGYTLYSGFEAEFIVCNADGKPVSSEHGMFINSIFSSFESFIYSMEKKMSAAGIDVAALHTEYGEGQFEMALAPKFGIEAADQMFLLKDAVKEMSQQHDGWQATFMSKPFDESAGNGLHFSHSLWTSPKTGVPDDSTRSCAFYDAKSENGLSKIARHWMAGLIRHGPALMALCSPTVNCYRRLGTLMTPKYVYWGFGDRCASICAKIGSPKSTYFENRLPGGSANPYLVMAATVAAGIDGIVNELECPDPMTARDREEFEKKNATDSDQQHKFQLLPKSLSDAFEALENDKVLCEALSGEFVRWFVESKRGNEIAKFAKVRESGQSELNAEREMYFKFL